MGKKKEIELPPQPSKEEMEQGLNLTELEAGIIKEIGVYNLSKVKRIAYYLVAVGLSIEEACVLSELPFDEYQKILDDCPLVKTLLEKKELEYKKDLLFVVTTRARSGDDKLALWLLERKYPEEFSTKRKGPGSGDDDILAQGISFIQKHGDVNPLVSEVSGKAFMIKKKGDGNILKTLGEFLK